MENVNPSQSSFFAKPDFVLMMDFASTVKTGLPFIVVRVASRSFSSIVELFMRQCQNAAR